MTTGDAQLIPSDPLARAWLAALARAEVRAGIERVYASAAAAIEARGPACWASGRCCRFAEAGHRLYVTGLEAAYLAAGVVKERGPCALAWVALETSPARACGFQEANLCGVHTIKPLACRMYFCDRSAEAWQRETLEALIAEVRLLHDAHAVEYRYGEWQGMLARFLPA